MNSQSKLSVRVEKIFRHPIKSISREEITHIKLERRKALPLDRMWALVHEKSSFDELSNEWQPCTKFLRGSIMPTLSALESIRTDDQNYNFNFHLKNKRNIDRKTINLLRNKEISTIIS